MRVFIIILWLILGVIYWWIWDSGVESCCKDKTNTSERSLPKLNLRQPKLLRNRLCHLRLIGMGKRQFWEIDLMHIKIRF